MATTNTKKKTNMPNYLGDYMSGNYTPGYDYVSNYYNPNSGYYNPSVYGYRGNRYNIPTNTGFSMQMKENDDAWNLGSLIGGLWGVQYNQRGAKKAGEEANAMLQDEYNKLMGTEQPKSGELYQQFEKANGNIQNAEMKDYSKAPGGMYKQFEASGGKVEAPTPIDHMAESRQYLMDKYGLTTGKVQDNPEGDKKAGTQAGQAVGGDISKIDVTKLPQGFNSDLLRANIVSKLKAAGRNDWQIAQAMQGIEPQLLGKQREYNDQAFGSLYQQYGQLIQNGQIDDAGMVLARMKQFNPEQAALLEKQYERAAGKKLKMDTMEDNIALYKKYFPNMSDQEIGQMILRGGKATPSGRSTTASADIYGNGSGWTKQKDAQRKYLVDLREKELKAGRQLPAHLAAKLEELDNEFLEFSFTKVTPKTPSNDYDSAMSMATALFEDVVQKTGSADKALAKVKETFGDGGMGKQIYQDVANGKLYKAWKGSTAQEETKEEPKNNAVKDYLMNPAEGMRTKNKSNWNNFMDYLDEKHRK